MDNQLADILVVIIGLLAMVVWWFMAKGTSYRKYILLSVISFSLTVITYITATSFDIKPLGVITIIAFISFFFFLIRAVLLDNKAKKEISDK